VPAGSPLALTVAAVDAYGNVVTTYVGTVQFSSSDADALLPADYAFTAGDAGMHSFDVIFQTPGLVTLTVRDDSAGLEGDLSLVVVCG
jgi:hypothetical protein